MTRRNDDADNLARLEEAIDYRFRDRGVLTEALTHRSRINETRDAAARDNERLEFFGDSILGFLLSDLLLARFPDSREGELSRLRSALVTEGSLAGLAEGIDLGVYLFLGRGEEKSGGRGKRSLLADAYEALLAAVYLDGGLEPVRRLVVSQFAPLLERLAGEPSRGDYKTDFQELAQALKGAPPTYTLISVVGPDHERVFTVAAVLCGCELARGTGTTKKGAEQEAARRALALLREGDSRGTPGP